MVKLTPAPLLGGYDRSFGDTRLQERDDLALVSLALPLGAETEAEAAIKAAYGLDLPAPGHSVVDKTHCLIRTAPDQGMLAFAHAQPDANPVVNAALKGTVYTTDQTDAWVILSLSGPDALPALERLCPIDLHPSAFGPGAVARTVVEHMGAMVICEAPDSSYLLLSASSSAHSFLHAVETSLDWTT